MTQLQLELREKPEFVVANWYNTLKQVQERNGRVGTMADLIRTKNDSQFNSDFWQYGARVATTLDYAKANPVLLIRNNSELLQLENAKKAVEAHRNDREFYITQDQYTSHLSLAEDEAKDPAEERTIFILPSRDNFQISKDNYFEVLRFLAEDPKQAEKYLERLSEKNIDNIDFYLINTDDVDKQEAPFQRQLWSRDLGVGSGLVGYYRVLGYGGGRAFGVFPDSGEASAQKISEKKSELYTPAQIRKALKTLKFQGLEGSLLTELKKNN